MPPLDHIPTYIPTKRKTRTQYNTAFDAAATDPGFQSLMQTWREHSKDHSRWAASTNSRRLAILNRWETMHQSGEWAHFKGREFDKEHIICT